jgi:hypothetical protein
MAIAVLSGCFAPPAAPAAASPGMQPTAVTPVFVRPWAPGSQQQEQEQQQEEEQQCAPAGAHQQEGEAAPLAPPAPVTKQSVRQQLAWVSGLYPLARPTRLMLKQVFNFFEEQRRGTAAHQQPAL